MTLIQKAMFAMDMGTLYNASSATAAEIDAAYKQAVKLADELSELHPSMGIDDINDLADDLAHLIGALC